MFQAQDPDYEQKIRDSFAKQGAMELVNGRIASIEPGQVVLEMPMDRMVTQQHGFVHAGIITTMLDSAAGYAAFSLMPADAAVLTIEFKTNLMAPAKGELFRFTGRVIKPGRTITFCEASAIAIERGKPERQITTMTATMMTVLGREDVKN
ncbi:MAG: PaaI family thioesterase [Pseudomonadota bacterium]